VATITFHSMADSAYLWTAMLAADEKGVGYEVAPLVLHSDEHFALNPFGKMPILQHGEVVLYETLAIVHYIDRAFDGPPLQPSDALGQAQVLRWVSIVNAYVFPTMNRFVKERIVRPAWGFASDEAFLAGAREALQLQVRLIGDAVASGGYLVGDRPTIADWFLLPHLLFFARTPEGGALLARGSEPSAWLERMKARASYAASPMRQALEMFHQIPGPTTPLWTLD
jgi:glutathione S-transferase